MLCVCCREYFLPHFRFRFLSIYFCLCLSVCFSLSLCLSSHQVCPGCGGWSEYVLTTPLFDSTTLTTPAASASSSSASSTFTITATKSSAADIYIQSASLDGRDYDCAFLPHLVLVRGGTLVSE